MAMHWNVFEELWIYWICNVAYSVQENNQNLCKMRQENDMWERKILCEYPGCSRISWKMYHIHITLCTACWREIKKRKLLQSKLPLMQSILYTWVPVYLLLGFTGQVCKHMFLGTQTHQASRLSGSAHLQTGILKWTCMHLLNMVHNVR